MTSIDRFLSRNAPVVRASPCGRVTRTTRFVIEVAMSLYRVVRGEDQRGQAVDENDRVDAGHHVDRCLPAAIRIQTGLSFCIGRSSITVRPVTGQVDVEHVRLRIEGPSRQTSYGLGEACQSGERLDLCGGGGAQGGDWFEDVEVVCAGGGGGVAGGVESAGEVRNGQDIRAGDVVPEEHDGERGFDQTGDTNTAGLNSEVHVPESSHLRHLTTSLPLEDDGDGHAGDAAGADGDTNHVPPPPLQNANGLFHDGDASRVSVPHKGVIVRLESCGSLDQVEQRLIELSAHIDVVRPHATKLFENVFLDRAVCHCAGPLLLGLVEHGCRHTHTSRRSGLISIGISTQRNYGTCRYAVVAFSKTWKVARSVPFTRKMLMTLGV